MQTYSTPAADLEEEPEGSVAKADIERLIAEIHAVENDPSKLTVLAPSDPLYIDPAAELVRPISALPAEIGREIVDALAKDRHPQLRWFINTYSMDGQEVPDLEGLRLGDRIGAVRSFEVMQTPNAIVHLRDEDLLVVSRGQYVAISTDGTQITFVSVDEYMRRQDAAERESVAEFIPAGEAARPAWATKESVFKDEEGLIGVRYSSPELSSSTGLSASIHLLAHIDRTTKVVTFLELEPYIEFDPSSLGSKADVHHLAKDFARFASALVEAANSLEAVPDAAS